MRKRESLILVLAMAVLATVLGNNVPVWAGDAGAPAPIDIKKYMLLDEVKPGMKGYGLTVFSGTTIEKFDAEVISIIYNIGAKNNLILARVSGGPIEKTGVIAGMSGSPIYIDGRIIGALAYSWAFSKEPIAGITPIDEMLQIFTYEQKKEGSQQVVAPANSGSTAWASKVNFRVAMPASASESVAMQPIMTPMVFSGFSRESIEYFRPQLEGWGIVPVLGGSFAGDLQAADAKLEEGAAVGVQLIRGDMMAAAIGTLTIREDDRVLAFGHPFMLSGPVDYPMTTAYIHTVLPSLVVSSKVGSSLKPVGVLTQDRAPGIMGVLNGSAKMVPVAVSAQRRGEASARTFHFEVARSRQFLPLLVGMALSDSLNQAASATGEFTSRIHYEIEMDGFETIRNDDFLSGTRGFPFLSSLDVVRDLSALLNNEFAELSIKSISVKLDVFEAIESARVVSARLRKDTIKPGEDIDLKVTMRPYMKDDLETETILHIPEHFPEGQAFLQISAAPQTAFFERMRAPGRFQPDGVEKLVRLVDEDYPGNRLDIRLLVADPGIVVKGQEMPALPSSVFSVISQTMGKEPIGITMSSVMLEKHIPFDFEVEGSVIVPITIDRKAK
ncbi:MAG: hypothetical protein HY801_16660 [Candidatus Lindowbacteria bacterium]|nr:hypothetical protein [Candidatus Lindowbacteria bacterium]